MFAQLVTRLLSRTAVLQSGSIRNISVGCSHLGRAKTYEGDGKTSIQILNNEADLGLMINGFSQVGFRLNNDMTILGPMIIFPKSVLSWNVSNVNDINEESLSLFTILEPKIDIIVIGIGDRPEDLTFYRQIVPIAKKLKMNLEILPTEQACATFNFLNSESRYVAGAMIPPLSINASDDEILQTKLRYQNLYEAETDVQLF